MISSLPATILTESFARGFEITLKSVKSSAEVVGSVGERLMKALGVVGMFLDWLEVVGGRLVVGRVVEGGKNVVGGFGSAVEGGEVEVEVVVEGVQLPETWLQYSPTLQIQVSRQRSPHLPGSQATNQT